MGVLTEIDLGWTTPWIWGGVMAWVTTKIAQRATAVEKAQCGC